MECTRLVLNSAHAKYAALWAALQTANSAKVGYDLIQEVLPFATGDADTENYVVVPCLIPNSERVGSLADINQSNYGDDFFDHEHNMQSAKIRLPHLLGRTGRNWRFVRPIQDADYGSGHGKLFHHAFNGEQDLAISGGAANTHAVNTSYDICDGGQIRIGGVGLGGALMGKINTADAEGQGSIDWHGDLYLKPGFIQPGYCLWQVQSPLPWEDLGGGIHVQGKFQGTTNSSYQKISSASWAWDGDWELADITKTPAEIIKRYALKGKPNLSDLVGDTGRGRYHAQGSFPGWEVPSVVKTFNGSSYTDITSGGTILPVGATTGFKVYFINTIPFSNVRATLSANGAGTHVVSFRYSKGSGVWQSISSPSLVDAQLGFKGNSAPFTNDGPAYGIIFNPRLDWAQDTINGSTGYILEMTISSGTVSTAAIASAVEISRDAVFIHRYNDGAPTRGMCHSPAAGNHEGLYFDFNNKANYNVYNIRLFGLPFHTNWKQSDGVTFHGVQYIACEDLQFTSGTTTHEWTYSKRGIRWWDQSDIRQLLPNSTIFNEIRAFETADKRRFRQSEYWSDVAYHINGFYLNGGFWTSMKYKGIRFRHTGVQVDSWNDSDTVDLWKNEDPTDHHSNAMRGSFDAVNCSFEEVGFEDILRAVEIYVPATGGSNAPMSGQCSGGANFMYKYGYHDTYNGMIDASQPNAGFVFSGDNDRMSGYRNITATFFGRFDGNGVQNWYFKDMTGGSAISSSNDIPPLLRNLIFDNCDWCVSSSKSLGPVSVIAIQEDASAATFTDITAACLPSSSGSNATMFPSPAAIGDALHIRCFTDIDRRITFNFATPGVGDAIFNVFYRSALGWNTVSNLVDGTNDGKQNGTISFTKPDDAILFDIAGEQCFDVKIEIISGTYTTVPVISTITGRTISAPLDIDTYIVKNIRTGIHRLINNDTSNSSIYVKDKNMTCHLNVGQSVTDNLYKIGSTTVDVPDRNRDTWMAFTKSRATSAALENNEFENLVMLPAA